MKAFTVTMHIAGRTFPLLLRNRDTKLLLDGFISGEEAETTGSSQCSCEPESSVIALSGPNEDALSPEFSSDKAPEMKETVVPSMELIRYFEDHDGLSFPAAEYYACTSAVSDALLPRGCIFHGAAFRLRGKAYLFTGVSGVGKSTQLKNWMKGFPGEIGVINGDKPALSCDDSGTITVYPSPWTGKENMHGADAAPLAGIICLKQGPENKVVRGQLKDIVPFLYNRVFADVNTREDAERVGAFTEALIKATPVFVMTNRGDMDSTAMIRQTLLEET